MISHKYRCVFTHVTKTAGRSVEEILEEKGNHNTLLEDKKQLNQKEYEDYFKWTIVRNPFDRFVSMYHFRKICKDCPTANKNWSFEEWMYYIFEKNDKESLIISQSNWIKIRDKIECDFIAKFEKLKEDFLFVSKKINCSSVLPHFNKTTHNTYYYYYKNKTKLINLIREKCAEDLKRFKYDILLL